MTPEPLTRTGCASLPASDLVALADLRRRVGITVVLDGGRAWVHWDPDNAVDREAVLVRLMPRQGIDLYARRDGHWYRHGARLPTFDVPETIGRPLHNVVFPAPVQPVDPPEARPTSVSISLATDDRPRPSTALVCGLGEVAAWADRATTAEITRLNAATAGGSVLVVGQPLPTIANAERYWGHLLLLPLGFRPDPELPEAAVRGALGASGEDRVLFTTGGVEIVPEAAFRPLSRSSIRLALRGSGR